MSAGSVSIVAQASLGCRRMLLTRSIRFMVPLPAVSVSLPTHWQASACRRKTRTIREIACNRDRIRGPRDCKRGICTLLPTETTLCSQSASSGFAQLIDRIVQVLRPGTAVALARQLGGAQFTTASMGGAHGVRQWSPPSIAARRATVKSSQNACAEGGGRNLRIQNKDACRACSADPQLYFPWQS